MNEVEDSEIVLIDSELQKSERKKKINIFHFFALYEEVKRFINGDGTVDNLENAVIKFEKEVEGFSL